MTIIIIDDEKEKELKKELEKRVEKEHEVLKKYYEAKDKYDTLVEEMRKKGFK